MKNVNGEEKPIIKLSKVYKTFFLDGVEVHALKGVSLEINKGEFVAITGASGSGKSTLLNMVGVLDSPTSGTIEINGIDTQTLSDGELARMRGKEIGFVFQSFNLQPKMTAWENVALPMRIHDYEEELIVEKVNKLMQIIGLSDRINHYPNQLSGGQQQRVAIARALSTAPAMILADEPTGNLDSSSGKVVMELLETINHDTNVTVVVVTHDPKIVSYAEKVVRIQDGEIKSG